MAIVASKAYTHERITDLLVRYWGMGKPLQPDEVETLLDALNEENRALCAPTHQRALERLREKGIT